MNRQFLYLLTAVFLTASTSCNCFASHGLSITGNLKYQEDFEQFDYTSREARQGGHLILHSTGSFDKFNPFTLKGSAPDGLLQYVFEPLAVASLDEPFSLYGLLAKSIDIAEDGLSVTFTIDENARFSDGSPVTPSDVKYSVDMLKSDKAHPFYSYYYADIKNAEVLDSQRVKLNFLTHNRELPLIASQISIMSEKFYRENGFSRSMNIPVGSGPYLVETFRVGKSITYKKNEKYWASLHPARKGTFNFDRITIKYYKDPVVAVEAFKAGEFDVMQVNIAKQWARDMTGSRFETKELIKQKFPHKNNAGIQGFIMNTRRSLFKDRTVRKAIGMAFDFEWTNRKLFFDQYVRSHSFFSNSYLAAEGLPSQAELALLEPFADELPEEVFKSSLKSSLPDQSSSIRERLKEAAAMLKKSGWRLQGGVLENTKGEKFEFEVILANQSFERVMAAFARNLKKIGIKISYRTVDPTLYTERINNFDFDMCVFVFAQSQSPGNEQRDFWHSSSADKIGSRNIIGIKSKTVDFLVEKIIYAHDEQELITACKALDRVLWFGYYLIPNWYMDGYRVAYRNIFSFPYTHPKYYNFDDFLMTWWIDQRH